MQKAERNKAAESDRMRQEAERKAEATQRKLDAKEAVQNALDRQIENLKNQVTSKQAEIIELKELYTTQEQLKEKYSQELAQLQQNVLKQSSSKVAKEDDMLQLRSKLQDALDKSRIAQRELSDVTERLNNERTRYLEEQKRNTVLLEQIEGQRPLIDRANQITAEFD